MLKSKDIAYVLLTKMNHTTYYKYRPVVYRPIDLDFVKKIAFLSYFKVKKSIHSNLQGHSE